MKYWSIAIVCALCCFVGCQDGTAENPSADDSAVSKPESIETSIHAGSNEKENDDMTDDTREISLEKIEKTDAEWKAMLSPMQYKVTRKHETEPSFENEYWDNKKDGVYQCICCGLPLFDSENKYRSGTGWPSFDQPIDDKYVGKKEDNTFFMRRTEVHCVRCKAHLGHVFDDGPKTTGLRYCINSASLKFEGRRREGQVGSFVSGASPSRKAPS